MSTPRATEIAVESPAVPAANRLPLSSAVARFGDLLAVLLVVAVALPMRLANIGSYSGKGDEGIRAEQLLLMAAGFRPVKEVFASQGPLSLDVFYPFYLALGQTLAGARLAVVVASILAILATYWTARVAGGQLGGWLAAAFLIASPTFLKNSRLALVEIPAILPAIVALGAALAYQRHRERRWLVLSALSLALALAVKPMVIAVVPAVGLALLLAHVPTTPHPPTPSPVRGRGGAIGHLLQDLLLYAAVAGGLLAIIVLWVGPADLYDQLIRYRVGSREAEGWSLRDNWEMLWGELQWDQPAFFALGGLGGIVLSLTRPRVGVPLLVVSHGANPAAVGLILLTAASCGTLCTPMAANFNIVPAHLLEMRNEYGVIRFQAPYAAAMLAAHIALLWAVMAFGW